MQIEDYRWLTSDAATPWLARAHGNDRPTHQIASSLRKDLSAERTHLVLEQAELRRRAATKFPHADRMFFTRKGLEQSTDLWVASHKARRFSVDVPTFDLCCGIGGDMLALANRGPVLAIDSDAVTALLAEANSQALGFGSIAKVLTQDATQAQLAPADLWHIDPDRRPQGRRVSRLEASLPSREWFFTFQQRFSSGALKLSPSDTLDAEQLDTVEWEFISRDGEVRQQVVYFGSLVERPGQRTCSVLARTGELVGQFTAEQSFDELPRRLKSWTDSSMSQTQVYRSPAQSRSLPASMD